MNLNWIKRQLFGNRQRKQGHEKPESGIHPDHPAATLFPEEVRKSAIKSRKTESVAEIVRRKLGE